jgi:DNA-binding MarR family transcriptional regulator
MSPTAPARHADSLAFLLSQVGARSAQLFAERLAPLGISPRAYGVLSNLAAAASGRTQQQLSDDLGIHRNNMVGLVDELEASGWARRHRSSTDRRAFDVRLTDAGAAMVARVDAVVPALDDELARGLDFEQRLGIIALLRQIATTAGLHPGVHPSLRGRR